MKSVNIIRKFKPEFLIIALGLDTSRNDPTGTWDLHRKICLKSAKWWGEMKLPTLITQEGGYNTHSLGSYARHFFDGFYRGRFEQEGINSSTAWATDICIRRSFHPKSRQKQLLVVG